MTRTARRQLEGKHLACYLENISGAEQPYTCTIEDELNIDFIDESKHVLAMFLNQELF